MVVVVVVETAKKERTFQIQLELDSSFFASLDWEFGMQGNWNADDGCG